MVFLVVGSALIFLAEKKIITPEAKTTGWFVLNMANWWKLICNRQILDSLGQNEYLADRKNFFIRYPWEKILSGTVK